MLFTFDLLIDGIYIKVELTSICRFKFANLDFKYYITIQMNVKE